MDPLKQKFNKKASDLREEIKAMLKVHGDKKVDEVKLKQIFGGARGIKMMVWETSQLDPVKGISFRGYYIPELREKLPKGPDGKEPRPEGLFWLMLVGEIPTDEEVHWLTQQWTRRSNVPEHVFQILDSMPANTHPMTQFITAIASMQTESCFARRYDEGVNKADYWDATYEDTMNLIARLPRIAAYIYRRSYHDGKHIAPDIAQDWAGNFAHMLGIEKPDFKNLMRLYLTIHADHEGGNASAHTTHLVGSTLSDAYLSLAGGMTALAGPLHGLANQEVIKWIFSMLDALGTTQPTKEQIADYVDSTLAAGQVIPGYGHAVLREPDPRFMAQKRFAEAYIEDDDIVNVVWKVFEVVPPILENLGKVKNPWPNVDAHSGALLVHYGLKEYSFYTVLFGVSRALGVLSSLCWARALGFPLERPKSVTTRWVKNFLAQEKEAVKEG
ncbi:MAG: citrate (Si)-synthase [Lewinellaceae bacterium]|nr:citrate (Si)-synthase [Phaeodactylibacter sp.]MCB0613119.1 citrate (Si)-synthase [Phaeodactylibacter sp.]MCB9347181.1 citrate (Si)-synthase [Lewinellaceae bacterium]